MNKYEIKFQIEEKYVTVIGSSLSGLFRDIKKYTKEGYKIVFCKDRGQNVAHDILKILRGIK